MSKVKVAPPSAPRASAFDLDLEHFDINPVRTWQICVATSYDPSVRFVRGQLCGAATPLRDRARCAAGSKQLPL